MECRNKSALFTVLRVILCMKRHIFYTLPIHTFTQLVATSKSFSEIFDKLQLCKTGPQYAALRVRIEELKLSTAHFLKPIRLGVQCKRDINFYLTENSNLLGTSTLKKKLFKAQLLEEECSLCHLGNIWNGNFISLQLDHINGQRSDNRLSNLRILCPNCHSQTQTYSGKKNKRPKHIYFCKTCGGICSSSKARCSNCFHSIPKIGKSFQVILWPTKEELSSLVWTKPISELCIDLKSSHNGLKKHCQKIGVPLPPTGYWLRRCKGYSHEESFTSKKKIRPKAKRMTPTQIELAKSLKGEGKSNREIGSILGFAHTSIGANLK